MKGIILITLWLLFYSSSIHASGKEDMAKWNSCQEKTIARYEREVGVVGLNEIVVNKCGPKPLSVFRNELRLMKEDCDLLYSQALNECLESGPDDLSPPSQQFQILLSPKVFKQKNFDALCRKVNQSGKLPSQTSFEKNICSLAETLPIGQKNWMSHPEIKRIRQLYSETEEAVKKGQFRKEPLPTVCVSEEPPVQATFYEDPSGVVRKYELSGGSDDSATDAGYYYDKIGKLRFVFQSLRAANGTDMETRTYFDEKGSILYQDERLKKGPGWAGGFPESIPNPREHSASLCK